MSKAPAFQLYTKDFDTDENVMLMTCEQEGAYGRLLRVHWREGSIPSALPDLAALVRLPLARFKSQVWPRVGPCFVSVLADGTSAPEGRLVNPRMDRDRKELEEYRKERSRSGKRGAESKWGDGSAIKEPMANDGSPYCNLLSARTANGAAAEISGSQPTDVPGESAPALETAAAWPEAEQSEFAEAVWEAFLLASGSTRLAGPGDYDVLREWMGVVPLRIVLRGIRDCVGKGKTLAYYRPAVSEAYQQWRAGVPA